jgi:hypothetical protein
MLDTRGWLEPGAREAFRAECVRAIPDWYSPWAHLAFPSLVGIGVIVAAALWVENLRLWELTAVPIVYVAANAFEWRAHRYVLHRRLRFLELLYDRHTPVHHRIYITDDMAMRSPREFRLVLIPAYGILMILLLNSPLTLALALLGQANLAALFVATSTGYVVSYEWLHLAYHLPAQSFIGRLRLVARLRRHHATHHWPDRMQHWNFNVTVPLWDWVRGTTYPGPEPNCPPPKSAPTPPSPRRGEALSP